MSRLGADDPRGHVTHDDLRAAVAAGMVNEAQAANLLSLAQSRRGIRDSLTAQEEPFELFKGFNEIFIVVGLVILFTGWVGVTGLTALDQLMTSAAYAPFAVIGMTVIVLSAHYFTVKRRMIAPSIALAIMFAISALQLGLSLGWGMKLAFPERVAFTFGLSTALLVGYYLLFRVPFVVAMIALGTFATAGSLLILGGADVPDWRDLFYLSNDGPFAFVTIGLGVVGLIVALSFDMSDPHRVSRRSAAGFWLHVVSAPAIVNTVALTLFEAGSTWAQLILLVFLAIMALFAVVIDRRSFLVAGVGYVVALAVVVLEEGAMMAILLLGLGLVVLGAQWERLRGALMAGLPAFPGKSRMPPWGLTPQSG